MRDIFVAIFPELGDIQGERIRKAIKDSWARWWKENEVEVRRRLNQPVGGAPAKG